MVYTMHTSCKPKNLEEKKILLSWLIDLAEDLPEKRKLLEPCKEDEEWESRRARSEHFIGSWRYPHQPPTHATGSLGQRKNPKGREDRLGCEASI
jgi:hypothetical protein